MICSYCHLWGPQVFMTYKHPDAGHCETWWQALHAESAKRRALDRSMTTIAMWAARVSDTVTSGPFTALRESDRKKE